MNIPYGHRDEIRETVQTLNETIKGHTFTEEQVVFIEVYAQTLDLKRAAQEAGISRSLAFRLRRHPAIQRAVTERLRQERVNPAEVIENAGRIMRTDMRDFLLVEKWTNDEGVEQSSVRFDLESAIRDDTTYAIKKVSFYKDGSVKDIEIESRLAAIEMVGRLFALFPETQRDIDSRSLIERLAELPFDESAKAEELSKILRILKPQKQKVIEGEVTEYAEGEVPAEADRRSLG